MNDDTKQGDLRPGIDYIPYVPPAQQQGGADGDLRPGIDYIPYVPPAQNAPAGETPGPEPQSLVDRIDTPLVSKESVTKVIGAGGWNQLESWLKDTAEKEIAHANPWRAALATFFAGAIHDTKDIAAGTASNLTSPVGAATAAASLGTGGVASAIQMLGTLYFGMRSLQAIGEPQQEGESSADFLQRRLLGSLQLVLASAGVAAGGKDLARNALRRYFGVKGDLADKVAVKVEQAQQARAASEANVAQIMKSAEDQKAAAASRAANLRDSAIPQAMNDILRDAAHALVVEQARVMKPFADMAERLKNTKVADAAEVRSMIEGAFGQKGVQSSELPPSAFRALGNRGKVGDLYIDGVPASEMPPQLAEALRKGASQEELNFHDLTRVREDLYDLSQSAGDSAVRAGAGLAHKLVTDLQESIARKNGFGEAYRRAKNDYFQFRHDLGSGIMENFLNAEKSLQSLTPKLAMLTRGTYAEAIATVLRRAGVDVRPLLDMVNEAKSLEKAPGAIDREARAQIRDEQSALKAELSRIGKENAVVPGKSDLSLAGKSNQEVNAIRLQKVLTDASSRGIGSPIPLVMTLVGLLRMWEGSPYGAIQAGYGASRLAMPKLVRSPAFQEWLLREANVEPGNRLLAFRLRQGIADLYPMFRRAAQSGALSGRQLIPVPAQNKPQVEEDQNRE